MTPGVRDDWALNATSTATSTASSLVAVLARIGLKG
jgi:hypothetical protein